MRQQQQLVAVTPRCGAYEALLPLQRMAIFFAMLTVPGGSQSPSIAQQLAGRVLPTGPVYNSEYRTWPAEDIELQLRRFYAVLGGENWYQNHGWDTELPLEPAPPPPDFNETHDMLLTTTATYEHVRLTDYIVSCVQRWTQENRLYYCFPFILFSCVQRWKSDYIAFLLYCFPVPSAGHRKTV
eukprot:SAG31_NODE_924_length_10963_cov_4.339286_12_plen_183_part_00